MFKSKFSHRSVFFFFLKCIGELVLYMIVNYASSNLQSDNRIKWKRKKMALQLYLTSSSLLYIQLPFTIVNHYTTTITKRHHQLNVRDFTQIFLLNLNRSMELPLNHTTNLMFGTLFNFFCWIWIEAWNSLQNPM